MVGEGLHGKILTGLKERIIEKKTIMSDSSIVTFNCRGLNETTKRQKLFAWFESEIFLQETFCTFEHILKSGW